MTPERHEQIERVFHAALELPLTRRSAFLEEACAGDPTLLAELHSLLASHEEAGEFIATSALEVAAGTLGDTPAPSLVGKRIDQYEILSLLGAGGMGEVYLARDTQLNRKVAIKFLQPHSAGDRVARRRLIREARSAAALDHPNICAIYQVFDDEKRSFIVMQYIEGETLAHLIARKPLPAQRALDIATQVAAALAEAHVHGIIHRDIKPQNIMLTPQGRVMVLDFGLARSIVDANGASSGLATRNTLTEDGAIAGTVAYMSPEQLRGEALDARSDVFSLGIVLYEMLTGFQPFNAGTQAESIAAILTQELQDPRQFVDITGALVSIVYKALRKKREERYESAEELLDDLRTLPPQPSPALGAGKSRVTSRIRRMGLPIAIIFLIATIPFLYLILTNRQPAIDSIAILPFTNASGDRDTEYLSDGISDSLINHLSQAADLKVASLSSVLRFKGQPSDPQDVARQLKVRAVLTGRIIQRGETLSISTELVDARDNRRIWGEQYSRKLADILLLQAEISQEIADHLKLRLNGSERQRLARNFTKDPEAYKLYIQGHYLWNKFTADGVRKSIPYYEQAIDKDPAYALAYSALADAYVLLGVIAARPRDVFPKAKAAALKAIELDESLAAAHISLGAYKLFYEWDWAGAERETNRAKELSPSYQKAIELNTNYGDSNHYYCQYLDVMGRPDEAIGEMKRALEFDPLAFVLYGEMGLSQYYARRYDQSIESSLKALEDVPNLAMAYQALGDSYQQLGRFPEAIAALSKARDLSSGDPWMEADLGNAYAAAGMKTEALAVLHDLEERAARDYISPYFIALIHLEFGENEKALDLLQKAYEDRSALLTWLKVDPKLDRLRSDPRFIGLERHVGFAP
jgi:serine/threonine-protein kinase